MADKYILDENRSPVPCEDLIEWAQWFETADRTVSKDKIGDVKISTVFLGLNHRFGPGSPLLFETMIFGGPHDGHGSRCTFWEDAERQHAEAVALVKSGINN